MTPSVCVCCAMNKWRCAALCASHTSHSAAASRSQTQVACSCISPESMGTSECEHKHAAEKMETQLALLSSLYCDASSASRAHLSLQRSLSALNLSAAYRSLSSPTFLLLSSPSFVSSPSMLPQRGAGKLRQDWRQIYWKKGLANHITSFWNFNRHCGFCIKRISVRL